jgi:hypothetical protein
MRYKRTYPRGDGGVVLELRLEHGVGVGQLAKLGAVRLKGHEAAV